MFISASNASAISSGASLENFIDIEWIKSSLEQMKEDIFHEAQMGETEIVWEIYNHEIEIYCLKNILEHFGYHVFIEETSWNNCENKYFFLYVTWINPKTEEDELSIEFVEEILAKINS